MNYEPEDDQLLVQEEYFLSLKTYMVVCRNDTKNFPLLYLSIEAASEKEAMKKAEKHSPNIKAIRAYPPK
jgi:hypothetical protein